MRFVIVFLIIMGTIVVLPSAYANELNQIEPEGTLFFESLQDVPVMQGLVELKDYTLVFDKPEGRIVEMVAKIEGGGINEARQYYSQSLPQLGWSRSSEDNYIRGNEHLSLNFEREQQESFLRITVEPR